MKEPEDYFDYIDLSELTSFAPENVVASREHGKLNVDIDQEYTPGVRIYFKGEDLIKLPGIVRIGKRSLKAYRRIDISLAELIVIPNEILYKINKKQKRRSGHTIVLLMRRSLNGHQEHILSNRMSY